MTDPTADAEGWVDLHWSQLIGILDRTGHGWRIRVAPDTGQRGVPGIVEGVLVDAGPSDLSTVYAEATILADGDTVPTVLHLPYSHPLRGRPINVDQSGRDHRDGCDFDEDCTPPCPVAVSADAIVAAGGWTAPVSALGDVGGLLEHLPLSSLLAGFPEVPTARGGIRFGDTPTEPRPVKDLDPCPFGRCDHPGALHDTDSDDPTDLTAWRCDGWKSDGESCVCPRVMLVLDPPPAGQRWHPVLIHDAQREELAGRPLPLLTADGGVLLPAPDPGKAWNAQQAAVHSPGYPVGRDGRAL